MSTPGILSATNSIRASTAQVPITHGDDVACSAGGNAIQPSAPARPMPNTVRYTRMPASHARVRPRAKMEGLSIVEPSMCAVEAVHEPAV